MLLDSVSRTLNFWLFVFALVVVALALLDALIRPPADFLSANKQKKAFWMLILGLGLAVVLISLSGIDFLSILALIAALVYLVDARPALQQVRRNRKTRNR